MKVCARRFNLFFALVILLVPLCGCQTNKQDKQTAALRVHIEVNPDSPDTSQTVSVLRADPVLVTIAKEPILTEANVIAAKVIATPDAPAIEIRFDENGTWVLEQYSASNPGRHFVIFGQWGEKPSNYHWLAALSLKKNQSEKWLNGRWLAAPLITRRISNGILSFTPDMSQEEANQFVLGLNNVSKKIQTGSSK